MKRTLALLLLLFVGSSSFSQISHPKPSARKGTAVKPKPKTAAKPTASHPLKEALITAGFGEVDAVIEQSIAAKQIPGAVLVVGHNGAVVYRKAYGNRALEPAVEPMTVDTIFDIASLTKPVATAMSVMKLFEQGRFRLNDPVVRYLPELGKYGKDEITIRQLMTHYSGLRPDVDLKQQWSGKEMLFQIVVEEKPIAPPGAQFIYSDINYEILGFLVERLSGKPLEQFAAEKVFQPLEMAHTSFLPPRAWLGRIAPTQFEDGVMLRGAVHDPTARRMGGVAGHAGVFSDAEDLSRFAQAMLDHDKVLSPMTYEKMTTPQQPVTATILRGLGWDIDSPYSSNRGDLLPVGSFGHTGFTGTSLWIDPLTKTYIVLLTNSVHPNGDVSGTPKISLRSRETNAIVAALKLELPEGADARAASITGYNDVGGTRRAVSRIGKVLNGIDVLVAEDFKRLRGKREITRVGVLTNHTGLSLDGKRTVDLLATAPGIKLVALFSPEHGAAGALDTSNIGNTTDAATGTQVYSVYGNTDAARHPPLDVVKQLDAVVIDIQDVGARFYTYMTSMKYFLEAAARADVEIYVLDRPNPITGTMVQGPVSDIDESFTNFHAVPVRHGMTMGELAQMMNSERKINARLTVVSMQGWMRGDWFDATGQMWVNPSPNMRNLNEATLYTGVALVEGSNVSVGRGTDTPFEVMGAPWIKARELSNYLNSRQVSGVRFVPTSFTPVTGAKLENQLCQGVSIIVTDRTSLDAPLMGVELASALLKLYPNDFKVDRMIGLIGNRAVLDALKAGDDPRRIADGWRDGLEKFGQVRSRYLLYK